MGLSTEAFTRLGFAAKEVGVPTADLTVAFAKLEEGIGKANTEGGSSSDTFTEIGLSAKQLENLSPDQAFNKIADAISKLKSPADARRRPWNCLDARGRSFFRF